MEKTVIITGAASGIGAACATIFAQNNYNVAICYNSSKKEACELSENLNAKMKKKCTEVFHVDVKNKSSVLEMYNNVIKHFNCIDVLINNAGIASQKLINDVSINEWDEMFNINVRGAFLCTQAVLPQMINKKQGAIINISSIWGVTGASCEVAYSATKSAIIGFTKALSKEVGPSGISVNCIAPGVINTPMLANFNEEDKQSLAEETPLCRLGEPQDIANTALFLASEGASFITGQVLCVDGGFAV